MKLITNGRTLQAKRKDAPSESLARNVSVSAGVIVSARARSTSLQLSVIDCRFILHEGGNNFNGNFVKIREKSLDKTEKSPFDFCAKR